MRLRSLFTVTLPVERVWDLLLGIADERPGVLRARVGGVAVEYHGTVALKDADRAARRIVAYAAGIEARDHSPASATITATLAPTSEGTTVELDADLSLGGRLAPFGAGVIGDVAGVLVKRFAATLEAVAPAHDVPARDEAPVGVAPMVVAPMVAASNRSYWLPAAMLGTLGALAATNRRGVRWAMAAVGAGLVLAGQRARSSSSR